MSMINAFVAYFLNMDFMEMRESVKMMCFLLRDNVIRVISMCMAIISAVCMEAEGNQCGVIFAEGCAAYSRVVLRTIGVDVIKVGVFAA